MHSMVFDWQFWCCIAVAFICGYFTCNVRYARRLSALEDDLERISRAVMFHRRPVIMDRNDA